MQSVHLCVWVIFRFCHTQQIVRGHAVELRQRDNAEWADVLEIVCLIFAEGGLGKPGLLRKLFQRQARSTRRSFNRSCTALKNKMNEDEAYADEKGKR